VKKAVELLDAPSKNTILMLNKYNNVFFDLMLASGRILKKRLGLTYTVKKAVELLDTPSKNTILMLNEYNSSVDILFLSSHVFFYPASEQH
jgi:hypothetical protein